MTVSPSDPTALSIFCANTFPLCQEAGATLSFHCVHEPTPPTFSGRGSLTTTINFPHTKLLLSPPTCHIISILIVLSNIREQEREAGHRSHRKGYGLLRDITFLFNCICISKGEVVALLSTQTFSVTGVHACVHVWSSWDISLQCLVLLQSDTLFHKSPVLGKTQTLRGNVQRKRFNSVV